MLITSNFVVINFPKTGSSFVRKVLKRIYRRRRWRWNADAFIRELMLPNVQGTGERVDQHGTLQQIPAAYQHLPVMSVMRNPYDRFLSMFEFAWWKEHPPVPLPLLRRHLPQFPDLSLDDFVDLSSLVVDHTLGRTHSARIGRQTVQFVRFFFKNPERALENMSDDYVDSGAFRRDMGSVSFLQQEALNDQLAAFLVKYAFSDREIAFARTSPRVNETLGGVPNRTSLWSEVSLNYIATSERLLLKMLNEIGLTYNAPPLCKAEQT